MKKWTNEKLIHIAMHDGVDLSLRYAAARELQERRSKEDTSLSTIIQLFGQGKYISEIADLLGMSNQKVEKIVNTYQLWRGRLNYETQ